MRSIFTLLILFSISFSQGQTRDTIYLWSNKVPGEIAAKHAAIKSDNTSGNVIRLSEVSNPALIVFKPENPNQSGASIIVCPGGGYNILAADKEGYEVAAWLNTLGYTAFVLQYRVPQKKEGALQDIQRAIRIVRHNGSKYNLDAQKIGVLGFSAGGHLSALASTSFNINSYEAIDKIDKQSSRPNFAMLIYPAYLDKGQNKSLSPELKIDENTPPFFIFGTSDDTYGNSSLVITTALRDKNVPVELHMLSKGGHGYGLRKGNLAAETWPVLAEKWMDKMLKSREIAKYQRTLNFPKKEELPKTLPKKENVWVFMMAGQSNMAGRGFVEPQDTLASERILTINKSNKIILAKEPLNSNEPTMKGLDCGVSFAKEMLRNIPDSISVLLVHTAVGGSSISQWIGDSIHRDVKLLTNFHNKINLAKKYGTLKGILWHQGESDAKVDRIPLYKERLSLLFTQFRSFAEIESLPIFIGELGSYRKNPKAWKQVNNEIQKYVSSDRNSFLIHTADLKHKGDYLHFNSEGQRALGVRYATEYLKRFK